MTSTRKGTVKPQNMAPGAPGWSWLCLGSGGGVGTYIFLSSVWDRLVFIVSTSPSANCLPTPAIAFSMRSKGSGHEGGSGHFHGHFHDDPSTDGVSEGLGAFWGVSEFILFGDSDLGIGKYHNGDDHPANEMGLFAEPFVSSSSLNE